MKVSNKPNGEVSKKAKTGGVSTKLKDLLHRRRYTIFKRKPATLND